MKIFVIRHGETTGDLENRYGGNYDDHLSDKGRWQAEAIAEKLKDKGIEALFSSSLIRAQETSRAIAEQANVPVNVNDDLKERNQYGILTGMVKEEAKLRYPEQVELLKDKLNTIEEAESYEDFSKRISEIFNKLTNDPKYNCIAIVSHGGFMRVLFRDILKLGELKTIGDCCFVELEKNADIFNIKNYDGLVFDF